MLNQKLIYQYREYKEEALEQIECIEEEDGTIRNRFMIKNHNNSPIFIEPVPNTKYTNWTVSEKDKVNYELMSHLNYIDYIPKTANAIMGEYIYEGDYSLNRYDNLRYGQGEIYNYGRTANRVPNKMVRDYCGCAVTTNQDYAYDVVTMDTYPAKKEMTLDKAFKILMEHAEKWDAEDEHPIVDADAMVKTKALLEKYTKRIEEEAKKIPAKPIETPIEKPVEKKNKLVDSLRKLFT